MRKDTYIELVIVFRNLPQSQRGKGEEEKDMRYRAWAIVRKVDNKIFDDSISYGKKDAYCYPICLVDGVSSVFPF